MGADQTLVTSTEQKNETTNNAQDVDDRSSRSEHLQAISNVLQRNEDETGLCGGTFALNNEKRSSGLLNSEFRNFRAKTYTTYYKVPEEYSPYKNWYDKVVPFKVEYNPLPGILNIVMPVKFMGPTSLKVNSMNRRIMTKEPTEDFMSAYMSSVNQLWSLNYQLYLDAVNSGKNESCDTWANLAPVKVNVFVKPHESEPFFYKVYYIPNTSVSNFRDTTGCNNVAFSEKAYNNRQAGINGNEKQNIFAHEFGHQIGLGDEYAVDYAFSEYTTKCGGVDIYPVYKEPELKVYERTEYNRFYRLSPEGTLFNHAGVYYYAEKMSFEGEKTGYVLKEADTKHELDAPLDEELGYCKAQTATDTDGKIHRAVYFSDRLLVGKKPGLRKYNLEKFCDKEIYHNSHRYMVKKGEDDNNNVFYYLADENGNMKKNLLDGVYTTHTKMVEEVLGEKYALENATIFDKKEHGDRASQFDNGKYMMNEGNDFKPHHYITFEYGMVAAIRSDSEYSSTPSQKAPNMEGDWIIR